MRDFFDNPLWAIVTGISVIAICITVYNLNVDPKISAMSDCTRGMVGESVRIGCANAIFGDQK